MPIKKELIAPCGMNCAVCSNYLAYVNKLNRSQCPGCRTSNKKCAYLFEKCTGMNHLIDGTADADFCFKCDHYPCKEIDRMDRRYQENYGMSVKANLEKIKQNGIKKFIAEQYGEHRCSRCGDWTSVHNGKCFKCEEITRLVEKYAARKFTDND